MRLSMQRYLSILAGHILLLICLLLLGAASLAPVMAQDPPAAPTDLFASVSAGGITLSWRAPAGAVDGYEIRRMAPSQNEEDFTTIVDDTGSSATTYTDASATTDGVRYFYQVKTIRGSTRSLPSNAFAITFSSTLSPTPTPTINTVINCEIQNSENHDILHCTVEADNQTITSATWTPSFEESYVQTTSRPSAAWVIADEYCGLSTDVEVASHAGNTELPTAETTITLECAPEPVTALSVSCENLIENNKHVLRCRLSGGDQTVDSALWTPTYESQYAQTKVGDEAAEATWIVSDHSQNYCGQTISVEVAAIVGGEAAPTLSTTFSLPCLIIVDSDCSLANAIRSANGSAQLEESDDSDGNDDCEAGADPDDTAEPPETGDDIILLTRNVTLAGPLPTISSRVQIEGNNRRISGDGVHHVFMVTGGHLGVNKLTITRALATTVGGGIYVNSGSLIVSESTIQDSKANDIGGAIYAIDSNVEISVSMFSGNMTVKSHGGAVYFVSSTGLHTLDIADSTFKNNTATEDGGALKTAGGIASINKSTFFNNVADEGGAIESSETALNITNSTFSNNIAREGGGLSSFSSFVTLTHTTWAYNSAEEQGGGIAIIGWTGNLKIRNTLITDSASGGDCHSGPNPEIIIEYTGNFIQDGSCAPSTAESQAAPGDTTELEAQSVAEDQQVIVAEAQFSTGDDARIGGLTGNPPHHPLQAGSLAIDAADPAYCLLDDQSLTARPQFGNCDIGAYEYPKPPRAPDPPDTPETPPPPQPTPTPQPTPEPTPEPTPAPNICPASDRIIVRSPNDDVQCAEVDTITLDKHPALQGARLAMRLWRSAEVCTHTITNGENLFRLAIEYGTTVEVLRSHNNLQSDSLAIGQVLLLPACESDDLYFAPGTEVCFAAVGGIVYVDTATAERDVHTIAAYDSGGMNCGQINRAGLVVLVSGGDS